MFRIWFERDVPHYLSATLAGVATPIGPGTATPNDLMSAIGSAHGAIASSLATYDGPAMDRAPLLRVIARTGIGVNNVDLDAATDRGIAVCNTPDAPTVSTAEHAITLMLTVAKQVPDAQAALRGGGRDFFASHQGEELSGRTLGLVGIGRIGSRVAHMAAAFDMRVIAYDPFVDESAATSAGIELVDSLDGLLAQADVVSLHVPLTTGTRHLIDGERLRLMKPGAILINTARGGLVDHDALLGAIEMGHLAGVGLDVTDPEPLPPDHPLLRRNDVVVTPHVAAATTAGKARLYESAVTQALQVLQGEYPNHLVNQMVWPVRRRDPNTKETRP
jgi:D-3-phosphoglycerate dehydrogenase